MARLPIVDNDLNDWGGVLNEFLLVSLNPDGTLIVTPMENPMTASSDLIVGAALGAPSRLPVGAPGQVLTVVGGSIVWANVPSGFSNPMTTVGDLIEGGSGGSAQRLAAGGNGQVLTVVGGSPAWANNPAGFPNPMTTLGDLISGAVAGAGQRLAIGATGQVLTVVGGVPTWANSAAGFSNPMTAQGDLISGASGGSAIRLPIGATGQVLTVAGGLPVWANASGVPFLIIPPSGDATGATDVTNLNTAITSLSNGGQIWLTQGTYYLNGQVTIPWNVSLLGQGWPTVINYLGNGSCLLIVDTTNPSSPPLGFEHFVGGTIANLVLDGTSAGANAILLDMQDVSGGYNIVTIDVRNATGTNAVGWRLANNSFATNNITGNIRITNCTTQWLITTLGGETAIEHINMDVHIKQGAGQNAIVMQNSVGMQGCRLNIAISGPPNAGACIVMNLGCVWQTCDFNFKAELTSAATTAQTINFIGGGAQAVFTSCRGILFFGPNYLLSNIGNQKFKFDGQILNDANLQAAQAGWVTVSSLSSGWTIPAGGFFRYRQTRYDSASGDQYPNKLEISAVIQAPSSSVNGVTIFTFPSGFTPALFTHMINLTCSVLNAATGNGFATVTTGGVMQSNNVGTSATVGIEASMALDF